MNHSKKNKIPENIKTIHLIAACGTAMGALACMLQDSGFELTGSDEKVYPPISTFLENKGVAVARGFNKKNLAYGPDLVVVGNAVKKENPEVIKMLNEEFHFCSMPQAVNGFFASNKKTVLVAGTHGKTTTASILAWILHEAGRCEKKYDLSFLIGGILKNFDSNYRIGKGEYFIIEGDEYDTAFFDKGAKFFHYKPTIAVLTNVEFDHADIFTDLEHVKSTFNNFLSGISDTSTLFAIDCDENVSELIKNKGCLVERYGADPESGWALDKISIDPPWTIFTLLKHGKFYGTFKTILTGRHNLLNVTASIAVADKLSIPVKVIKSALTTFKGIKRRQEMRGEKNKIIIMDDFAHHPTAVRETIKGLKPYYPNGRLIAVFEPGTNSSMRKVFQEIYPLCFDNADLICIRKPPFLQKVPVDDRFSSEKLVLDLKNRGKDAYYFEDTKNIINFLVERARPHDLILIMSNGGFDNIHERLLDKL